jgi:hypothetical protein
MYSVLVEMMQRRGDSLAATCCASLACLLANDMHQAGLEQEDSLPSTFAVTRPGCKARPAWGRCKQEPPARSPACHGSNMHTAPPLGCCYE